MCGFIFLVSSVLSQKARRNGGNGFSTTSTFSFVSLSCAKPRHVRLVSWTIPGVGNPGTAGFGGVFRKEREHWVLEFSGRHVDCTNLEAELWGIFRGLELVQNEGMEALEVDSDLAMTVVLINEDPPERSPHKVLIQECKALWASTWCTLKHTLRRGNKVADRLANMGVVKKKK